MLKSEAKAIAKLRAEHAHMKQAMRRIAAYTPPNKLRRIAEKKYGLPEEEAVEMAYDNVLEEAKSGLRFPKAQGGSL
jgi:hypothetical protein